VTRLTLSQAKEMGIIPAPKSRKQRTGNVHITKAKWDAKRIDGGIVLVIPESMPSLNEWKLWHWAKQQRFKSRLSDNITLLALTLNRPRFEMARVEVVHYFRTNRRRDTDNMAPKFLLDALHGAGVLVDDNSEVLELPEPVFKVDSTAWRTEIYVYRLTK